MTSDDEKAVCEHLVKAFKAWCALDDKHPDDVNEFRFHIHAGFARKSIKRQTFRGAPREFLGMWHFVQWVARSRHWDVMIIMAN